ALFFFFSSRSRHTRFSRDWSSDVCSSDLPLDPVAAAEVIADGERRFIDLGEINGRPFCNAISIGFAADLAQRQDSRLKKFLGVRSEERRVGKESRGASALQRSQHDRPLKR